MRRQLLLGGSVLVPLLAGSLPARAQVQEPASQPQAQEASQTEISQEELQQFAKAIKQLQAIQQESEKKVVKAIEGEGLSQERFREISQVQQNPETQSTTEVTEEEMQSFEKAVARVTELLQAAQSKMEQAVRAEGLEIQRFNQIATAVRQTPALQQELQQMTQN